MKTFLQIVQMLPAIIEAIKTAEQFAPVSGAGKAKLDFILGLIADTVDGAAELSGPVKKTIERVVTLANAVGVFKKA